MKSEGLQPNVISYAAAMSASRDNITSVLSLMERMKDDGIAPNTVVLTSAINALARAGGNFTGDKKFFINFHNYSKLIKNCSILILINEDYNNTYEIFSL